MANTEKPAQSEPDRTLVPFDGSGIPQSLRDIPRWAPWEAKWNPSRGKFDKIPRDPNNPNYRISTANPQKWGTFEQALAAYKEDGGHILGGIGFCVTDLKGLVLVDLDDCVDRATGALAPWAREVVNSTGTYTEISPSGRGVRQVMKAELADDWVNHDVGIEVYGGNDARFLTITGKHLQGTPTEVVEVGSEVLQTLKTRYANVSTNKVKKSDIPPMPQSVSALSPALLQGVLAVVDLPPVVRDFLTEGECGGDRSRALHSAGVALLSAGLSDVETFAILCSSPFAMEVALGHRSGDTDKAQFYLWDHQVIRAKPKARSRALSTDDFEDLMATIKLPVDDEQGEGVPATENPLDQFENLNGAATPAVSVAAPLALKKRFKVLTAPDYGGSVKKLRWWVRGVIPDADLVTLFGESGAGKSFYVMHLLCCVALGLPFFGKKTRQGRVLYVAAEGASGVTQRLEAWCCHNNRSLEDLRGHFFILGDTPNLLEKADVRDVVTAAKDACPEGYAICCLDTLAQVTPGANENSGEDMGRALAHTRVLRAALLCTILLVAHQGKDSTRGMRGWSGMKGASDAQIELVRTSRYRAATVVKLKDGTGEGVEYRFNLAEVFLGIDLDEEGEMLTSCAIDEGDVMETGGEAQAVAQAEAKERASGRKVADKAMRGRPLAARDYLLTKLETGVREYTIEAIQKELAAVLLEQGYITADQIAKRKGGAMVMDALRRIEETGFLKIAHHKVTVVEGLIS